MKRLIIVFMSILCLLLSATANADDNNRTRLTIQNESFTGNKSGEVYRSLYYNATIVLIASKHLIEILHFGIGDAEVYLLNHNNQVVEQVTIYEGASNDYLDIPAQSGNYKLVIWSNDYYGEAYFKI